MAIPFPDDYHPKHGMTKRSIQSLRPGDCTADLDVNAGLNELHAGHFTAIDSATRPGEMVWSQKR
jgi:hypothetical protein